MPAKPPSRAERNGSRRRWPIVLLTVLAILAGGHGLAWWLVTGRLEEGAALWAAQRRAEGWQVSHGPPARAGWPLASALSLPDLALQRDGMGWQADSLRLTLSLPGLDRLRLEPSGPQALSLHGTVVPLAAEGLVAELPIGAAAAGPGGLPREAALRAGRLRLDLPAGPLDLSGTRLDWAAAPAAGDPLATLRGTVAQVVLPPGLAGQRGLSLLGPSLEGLRLDLALTGPWPGPAGTPALRAARWRDAGGTLELRTLALAWGAATATASATLALDATLQPAGAGTLRLAGAPAVLEAAQAAGLVGRRDAAAAGMLLAMMQRTPPEGGPPRLEVPVVLERRALSLAGLTLLRLPPWRWPGAAPP